MSVSVAEYYGQRTDIDNYVINPVDFSRREFYTCPFTSGNKCKKIKSGFEPVCSVRKSDGTLWIVCSERLCSTKKDIPFSEHQKNILLQVGKYIYSSDVSSDQLCFKREEQLQVIEDDKYSADYIVSLKDGFSPYPGPDRLVLEMQGGGETNQTGKLTKHIKDWRNSTNRNNSFLRELTGAYTLETNAWRRQQEQFIVKGNIAMKTWKGYGIVFCVGSLLYDYLMHKIGPSYLPDLKTYNWTLAIIAFKEDDRQPLLPGPIPLTVDNNRTLYTNYQTFVQALINQGTPTIEAFRGTFLNLENHEVNIQ